MNSLFTGAAAVLLGAPIALAAPVLQFDVNGFSTQSVNSAGANSSFGGLTHTGAVQFTVGTGTLNGIFIQNTAGGPFSNANLSPAFTLSAFSGQVNLVNGQVTGGSLLIKINNI